MRAIREIKKPWPQTPRCDHELTDKEAIKWNLHRGKDIRCSNTSRYRIGRKNYCGKHAGAVAIKLLLEQE